MKQDEMKQDEMIQDEIDVAVVISECKILQKIANFIFW